MEENKPILPMALEQELLAISKEETLELKPVNDGLSDDQRLGHTTVLEWLAAYKDSRNDNNFFALKGSAGTGKTTLVSKLLKDIKYPYRTNRICICAPTHKAKKVLQEKTKWRQSETLQALLGLKLNTEIDQFDPNSPEFEQLGERKMKDYDLVIIDESSMVNTNLYESIKDCARIYGTKVLFVGDPLQLNPVKEYSISPALIAPIHQFEIKQIMRQGEGNPLIKVLDALRYDIQNDTSTFTKILKEKLQDINEKGEGYIVNTDGQDFANLLSDSLLSDEFASDKNFCRYISWTNQSITDTNKFVRKKVLSKKSEVDPTIQIGEVMLAYRTVTEDDDVILTNSDDFVVEEVSDSNINDYEYPIQTCFVHLRGIDTGVLSKVHIVKRTPENYENYVHTYKAQVAKAQRTGGKRGWGKFYEFKNSILLLDTIYEGTKVLIKKDIDYGYGITIHKSQGSTYNTVFVNGKDINKNMTLSERRRLWYVALSRASTKAVINL